jgi:hypothetical protein
LQLLIWKSVLKVAFYWETAVFCQNEHLVGCGIGGGAGIAGGAPRSTAESYEYVTVEDMSEVLKRFPRYADRSSKGRRLMSVNAVRSLRLFSAKAIPFILYVAAFICPAMAAEGGPPTPDLSGQWGRDLLFFEPPPSGPGPVSAEERKADGTVVVLNPCCFPSTGWWLGDHTSPILKPEAAEAVRKFSDLALRGVVTPDLHNTCWPEPAPFVLGTHFAVQILQQRDEVILLYLINTVRHVRLNEPHPENLTPSRQGHSVGWYEGDTLVIDTVGIKVTPLSTVDLFGTPHSRALHIVERYRLIDGETAAETQRKHGAIYRPGFLPYGRGNIDGDTAKRGLQVEFTVEDEGVFTTPWSGQVTYRRLIGDYWPEAVCAENPTFFGTDAAIPTAHAPDF